FSELNPHFQISSYLLLIIRCYMSLSYKAIDSYELKACFIYLFIYLFIRKENKMTITSFNKSI
ncbi:MAG: hypothetical protein N7Q72_02735, partial [Spiroplasma sp. Tabriz.8]|nr:hypothetical protein [Spiroplasma sp. Tabriz.8]